MSAPSASLPFDPRPLTEPVDPAAVRAYVQELRRSGRVPGVNVIGIVLGVIVGALFLGIFGSMFVGIISSFSSFAAEFPGPPGALFVVIPFLVLAVLVASGVAFVVRMVRGGAHARWYRLDRFAAANGMRWYPEAADPPLPGMIFDLGHSRLSSDIVRGDRPRLVEFANYQYKTGSDKEETTHSWGYVAVKLATPLPHIVLDAVGNNSVFGSNLPASFDRHQRLSLEGDFDAHFALYCPEGYERDALYLFTPDIMVRFIDNAAALDVEIVDDWLFLYTQGEVSTLDPATWAWLFSVVGALLDKLGQWERWRDDRLVAQAPAAGTGANPALPFAAPGAALRPPAGVAAPGQRLKRTFPWGVVLVMGGVIAFFFLSQFGVFSGILGLFFPH